MQYSVGHTFNRVKSIRNLNALKFMWPHGRFMASGLEKKFHFSTAMREKMAAAETWRLLGLRVAFGNGMTLGQKAGPGVSYGPFCPSLPDPDNISPAVGPRRSLWRF